MKELFRCILMCFTYPKRLAEAVNRAHDREELDLILKGDVNGNCES